MRVKLDKLIEIEKNREKTQRAVETNKKIDFS